ncbi:MAG: hypothetical protein IJJ26_12775 [Victivallales bacterium]|nr:hypothetical protein [Victivallales bacterium]
MFQNSLQVLKIALALGVLACFISLILTRLLLWLLPKWGLLDKPDFARHIHTRTVPRGGGLGMLLAFVGVTAIYFGVFHKGQSAPILMLKLMAPLGILLPLGILDDRYGLRPRTKFLFQILAAGLAWHFGFRMSGCFGITFPVWLGFFFTIFWIVAFINAFNMIDGVDGLAAGVGIISATCMGTVALLNHNYALAILLIVFAFSLLGFLYFNWHPARLFMGDTGSMFIGYVLATAGLRLNAQTVSVASIGIPLLACGIPVLDICLAVWRRIMGAPTPKAALEAPVPGDAPPEPVKNSILSRFARLAARLGTADQSHIHHRLLRHFQNNQRKTTLNIYAMAFCLGVVGIVCFLIPNNNIALALLIILGTFSFILNRLAFIELWNSTEKIYHDFQSPRTGIIISYALNPIWDLLCIAGAYLIAARSVPIGSGAFLRYLLILMGILCCSRSYRVFWNFAVSDDYFRLGVTLIFGFLLARTSDYLFHFQTVDRLHSYAAGIAVSLILLERLFFHYFRNAQIRRHANTTTDTATPVVTALIGVTPMARLYRNLLSTDIERAANENIAGLIVEDRHFLHSYCFGIKVLGAIDNLKDIVAENHINKLVITRNLAASHLQTIIQFSQSHGIPLTELSCREVPVSSIPHSSEPPKGENEGSPFN